MAKPASRRSRFDRCLEALHSRLSIAGWIVRAGGYTLLRSARIKPASRGPTKNLVEPLVRGLFFRAEKERLAAVRCSTGQSFFLFGPLGRSLENSWSGKTRSTWLTPSVVASSNSVTTVGLRRPCSNPLIYCCVKPEASENFSCVKPFCFRSFRKFRPTNLRISICASCFFTYYEVYLL